jgi:uncharacterized membrane protein YhhN
MGAVLTFLWHVDAMPLTTAAIWAAAIVAGLWANGRFMQGGLAMLEVLTVECAALSTVSAMGMLDGYMVFKPLTMLIAIAFVAARAYSTGDRVRFDALLMVALVFSLAGDVFLMLPGNYFIPGLASFLVAHIFYIALFRQGHGWFPSRRALVGVLAVGAMMYSIVWGGLNDPVLKIAVAAYVTVISLMAAQAIGRATITGDAASRWVALGACVFMVSDSLIAINKFVTPVALSSLWILATYYCAQMLILHNARRAPSPG